MEAAARPLHCYSRIRALKSDLLPCACLLLRSPDTPPRPRSGRHWAEPRPYLCLLVRTLVLGVCSDPRLEAPVVAAVR